MVANVLVDMAADLARRCAGAARLERATSAILRFPKAVMAGARKSRVIGNIVLDPQPAKPAIGQVDSNLGTKLTLRANGKHIADEQHTDHRLRINRGVSGVAVKTSQPARHAVNSDQEPIDPTHQVIRRNHRVEIKRMKQTIPQAFLHSLGQHATSFSILNLVRFPTNTGHHLAKGPLTAQKRTLFGDA